MRVQPVRERSQIVEAKQEACGHAIELGFDSETADRVAIVATEGATNFIRHAGAGEILFGCEAHASGRFDVVFIDSGPGISRPERALEDGYSTAGGPGLGLGAMRRLSDSFEIYSREGGGVTIATSFLRDSRGRHPRALHEAAPVRESTRKTGFSVDGFIVSMPGQASCGDGWCFRENGRR
ncbi:MAG: ATP-binding protein [Rhodospirillaceae bacterium]